jgi:hypothetical protein
MDECISDLNNSWEERTESMSTNVYKQVRFLHPVYLHDKGK